MTPRWLTRSVRRIVASPQIYGLIRSTLLFAQRMLRRADEPDLWFLARIPARESELVLDVGANGGQSAVAISFIRPAAQIMSYEPIPMLWPELRRIGQLLGPRFAFRGYALGSAPGAFSLYIPVSGRLPITTRATTSQDVAHRSCAELEREIGLETSIAHALVEVRTGDAEGLAPAAIKIDVEGAEFEVVRGLSATIADHRPVVILERSESYADCAHFFREIGYDILTHDPATAGTMHLPGLSSRNWIASPPETTPHLMTTELSAEKRHGRA